MNKKIWLFGFVFVLLMSFVTAAEDWGMLHYWESDNNLTDSTTSNISALTDSSPPADFSTNARVGSHSYDTNSGVTYGFLSGHSTSETTRIRTVDLWFNVTNLVNFEYIFGSSVGTGKPIINCYLESPSVTCQADSGAVQWTIKAKDQVTAGQWHHLVLITGSGGASIHIDGNTTGESNPSTYSFSSSLPTDIRFGANRNGNNPIDGYIDNMMLSEYEYTTQNITDSYNAGAGLEFDNLAPPPPPPAGDTLNVSDTEPFNNTQYNTNLLNFNFSVNSSLTAGILQCNLIVNDIFNQSSFGAVNTTICLQETSNISAACGGLTTGNYTCLGNFAPASNPNCDAVFDGNYLTSDNTDGGTSYMLVNYTKPSNALSSSLWEAKYGFEHNNITLPTGCFDLNETLELRLRTKRFGGGPCPAGYNFTSQPQCYDHSVGYWINVSVESSESLCGTDASKIYEESMHWNLSNSTGIEVPFFFDVPFDNTTEETINYYAQCFNDNEEQNSTSLLVYLDNVFPQIDTNFTNHTTLYKDIYYSQWNFTDDFSLFSYNISIDGVQIASQSNLSGTFAQYNLTIDPTTYAEGNYTVTARMADGHTANELGGEFQERNGLFNDYMRYDFYDGGYVRTESKTASLFDSWSSEKKYDRYTQIYEPSTPSPSITLIEKSDQPIHIKHQPGKYNDYWLIIGNHWKDYVVKNEPQAKVSMRRISDYEVHVTVSGLKNPERIEFQSIGDLNVVENNYTFSVTNATFTFTQPVLSLQAQTMTLEVNTTPYGVTGTNATLNYDGSNKAVVKNSFANFDRYTSNFLSSPGVAGSSSNVNFSWKLDIESPFNNETQYLNDTQTISGLGVDNCSVFSVRAVNFTLLNGQTNSPVNGTIDGHFTVWTNDPSNTSTFNLTWTHTTVNDPVGICIFPNTLSATFNAQIEYEAPGFETKLYYFNDANLTNQTNSVDLILDNGTSQVTLTVTDFNDNPVPDVFINVQKYDVPTNTFTTAEIVKTDSEGNSYAQMILNTVWYSFILNLGGEVVLQTLPTKIVSTTKNFRINIDEADYFDQFSTIDNLQFLLTNNTQRFSLTFVDTTGNVQQTCLKVIRRTINADTTISDNCTFSASSTQLVDFPADASNSSDTFIATAYVIISDDYNPLDVLSVSFDNTYQTYGQSGIFISFLLAIVAVMIGLWSPVASIMLLSLVLVGSIVLGMFYLSWPVLIAWLIMAGITVYRMGKE